MKDINFNPYIILGISQTADENEIKRAYRRLVQRLHPDSNPDHREGADTQFQLVSAAYQLLIDARKRRSYDDYIASLDHEGDSYFTLRATPSKRSVMPLDEEQVIYLLAEIFPAPQIKEEKSDISLNLTLVLDQSNSMNDGKRIERVKVAAQQIIEQLSENDIISLVVFNDRASVIIPATKIIDKAALRARVAVIRARGGTEIYKGLKAGFDENKTFLSPTRVNHILLLTDGHTFGDQERSLELAEQAREAGIGISAMGIGSDWNDDFLDELASKTGGASEYINSSDLVIKFLNNHVRNLTKAFAQKMELNIATDPGIELEMAFALAPTPQPLSAQEENIPLPSLKPTRQISVLLQFGMRANLEPGFRTIARLVVQGNILQNSIQAFTAVSDLSIEVTNTPPKDEVPPAIMDALSKLTLYQLQEKAKEAMERGDIDEATRRLNNLATRLLELGEDSLAKQALLESEHIAKTNMLSAKGQKTIKYQTRALMGQDGLQKALSSLLIPPEED